jgi:hypothetical protein
MCARTVYRTPGARPSEWLRKVVITGVVTLACRNVGNLRVEVQDPGAVLMLVSLISAWNLPAAIVEVFWALISIYGLLKHGGWLLSRPRI